MTSIDLPSTRAECVRTPRRSRFVFSARERTYSLTIAVVALAAFAYRLRYIINLDLFFEPSESPYARAVMRDGSAKARHEQKRHWQP
jgi:hypothetical protein